MATLLGQLRTAARRAAPFATFALRGTAAAAAPGPIAPFSAVAAATLLPASPALWIAARPYASKTKKDKKGKKATVAIEESTDELAADEPELDVETTTQAMERALDHLQHELAGLRTGRATTGMLDHVKAEVYDEHLSLKTLGITVVRDPQLLVYTAFDPDTIPQIEKAIRESPLELNPRVAGTEIQVPVPRPTAESLAAMKKVCKGEAEAAKVSIRHARQAAMAVVKKVTAEDARFSLEKEVQRLTDLYIAKVVEIEKAKERAIQDHST